MWLSVEPGFRLEGPPPGLAQGRWDVDRSLIIVAGVLVVVVAIGYFVARVRRARGAL
jgi:hypothetical protein